MSKPLHHHLTAKDKRDRFWSELGMVRQKARKSNDQAYRDNYDKIFRKKSAREDTAHDSEEKQTKSNNR